MKHIYIDEWAQEKKKTRKWTKVSGSERKFPEVNERFRKWTKVTGIVSFLFAITSKFKPKRKKIITHFTGYIFFIVSLNPNISF